MFSGNYLIQPKFILGDLIDKGLLQSLYIRSEDDNISMKNSKDYCVYHQRRCHSTNFCKVLEVVILDLIT